MPYAINAIDNARTYYEDDGGAGAPVLFYSGLTDSIEFAKVSPLARALEGKCRRIFADHRGHGRSDKPHDPAEYSLRLQVADVVAVLDATGVERVHFIGSSWGARLGFALGEHAPERVASLILGGNQPYEWDFSSPLIQAAEAAVKTLAGGSMTEFVRVAEERLGEPFPEPSRSQIMENDALAIHAAWQSTHSEGAISKSLSKWRIPCLIYTGMSDDMHDAAKRAADEIPGAIFVSLPDVTHMTVGEAEGLVVDRVLELISR